jgi:hypothetical protein
MRAKNLWQYQKRVVVSDPGEDLTGPVAVLTETGLFRAKNRNTASTNSSGYPRYDWWAIM